jgi:hypothetical protein
VIDGLGDFAHGCRLDAAENAGRQVWNYKRAAPYSVDTRVAAVEGLQPRRAV